eukprot:jgi/Mesvir1/1299/Mv03764-RA.1
MQANLSVSAVVMPAAASAVSFVTRSQAGEGSTQGHGEESSGDVDAPDALVNGNDEFVATLNNMLSVENSFDGLALATLIRQKWGKSYDVRFQKQTFLGKEIWVLNVMWKFVEQSSFPMTEERYLEHLQATVDVLRDMGAISLVRNALLATTEKPRVGKAVSIQIAVTDV